LPESVVADHPSRVFSLSRATASSARDLICSSATRGSASDILRLGRRQNLFAEERAQGLGSVKAGLAAHQLGEFGFDGEKLQAGNVTGVELHQNVHVAGGREIVSQDGSEQGQFPNMATPAETGNRL